MVRPERFELPAFWFVARRSIQLSYGRADERSLAHVQKRRQRAARTLRVEYDATRLNAAMVTQLVLRAGLEIAEELPLIPPPPQVPAAAEQIASPQKP